MTELERVEKFEEVKKRINGSEAELFKGRYDGRFFTGDMTFVFDGIPYNMYLYQGKVIDVYMGQPANGYYVGISGSSEQWDDFFRHRNFQLATSIKHNPLCFKSLGSALHNRQNNSVIAQMMRVIATVMMGE